MWNNTIPHPFPQAAPPPPHIPQPWGDASILLLLIFVLLHHLCLDSYLAFSSHCGPSSCVTYQNGFSFPTGPWPFQSSCLDQLRVQTWVLAQSLSLLLLTRVPCLDHSISARQPLLAHTRASHHLSYDDINMPYVAYAYDSLWVILEIWILD